MATTIDHRNGARRARAWASRGRCRVVLSWVLAVLGLMAPVAGPASAATAGEATGTIDVAGSTGAAIATAASGQPVGAVYVPLGPVRVLDTRTGSRPAAAAVVTVPIRGRDGVPSDVTAVALTVTVTDPARAGYVTVWGDGARPDASNLNVDGANQTRANLVLVAVGADGAVRLYTDAPAHLVVDLAGVFRPVASASGRLVPVGPTRVLDTRDTDEPLAAREVRTVDLSPAGVPADASAAVVSLTVIGDAGWWAAWPAGDPWPGTSVLNVTTSGIPVTASAVVPVRDGRIAVLGRSGGALVVDVAGFFTGASAPDSSEGRFVAMRPTRVLDSRRDPVGGPVVAGAAAQPPAYPFSLTSVGAVAANVTAVLPSGNGFLTAWPAQTKRPWVSVANVASGQVLATGAVVPSSSVGIAVYAQQTTNLVIDITGYFTGTPRDPAPASGFQVLQRNADGSPWRWNPCRPITVLVNPDGAPPGALADLTRAINHLRSVTGLPLVDGGTTNAHALATTVDERRILVHWRSPADEPRLTEPVVALGGAGGYYAGSRVVLTTGVLVVSSTAQLAAGFGGANSMGTVLLHELGHVVGLAHVGDDRQVMYPTVTSWGRYQAGDVAGLIALGATAGCVPGDDVASLSAASLSASMTPDGAGAPTPLLIDPMLEG